MVSEVFTSGDEPKPKASLFCGTQVREDGVGGVGYSGGLGQLGAARLLIASGNRSRQRQAKLW